MTNIGGSGTVSILGQLLVTSFPVVIQFREKKLFHFWRQILILSSAAISPHPFPVPLIPMLQILPNALDLRFKYSFAFRSNIWETEKSKFKFGFRTFFCLPNLSFYIIRSNI